MTSFLFLNAIILMLLLYTQNLIARIPLKKVGLTLLITTLGMGAMAQSKREIEVAKAVEQLRSAMISADKNQLESIAEARLSYGHSGGKIENKAEFVDAFVSGKSRFTRIDLTDQTIQVYRSTAVVRHKLNGATHDLGKEPGTVHLSILLVWVKQKGKWQLVARQAVKI